MKVKVTRVSEMFFVYLLLLLLHHYSVSTDVGDLCGVCRCSRESHFLSCSSLNLTVIPPSRHKLQEDLYVVDISNNRITILDTNILRQHHSSLRRLIAARNQIVDLPATALRNMTSLIYLDLSWNNIASTLTKEHFDDVIHLDYLSLSHNHIACLMVNSFQNNNLLTELDLSYNKLTSQNHINMTSCFSRDVICNLKNLIVLRISSNHLPKVFASDGFFSCLPNLTLLEASNCGIKILSKNAFSGLGHMISLDLSDNSISNWPSGVLQSTNSLVYLDLGQNILSELPLNFLRWCPELTHLQLRNNRLHIWDYGWLEYFGRKPQEISNLTKLQGVKRMQSYLSHSQVPLKFKSSNFSITKTKRNLYLDWSENSWICSCDVISFVGWLIEEGSWLNRVKGYHDVICHERRGYVYVSRSVYVDGKIDPKTVADLMQLCTAVTSSLTSYSHNDINTTIYLSTIMGDSISTTTLLPLNTSDSGTNLREQSFPPHLAVIISVLVIVDAFAYLIIIIFIKKRTCCRKVSSVVAP